MKFDSEKHILLRHNFTQLTQPLFFSAFQGGNMAKTYQPKRFTDIGLLKRLDFVLLIRLLERHKSFFDRQEGFAWAHDPADFSFDSLAKIMMGLDTAAPMELLESLYYIEQLSDDEYVF